MCPSSAKPSSLLIIRFWKSDSSLDLHKLHVVFEVAFKRHFSWNDSPIRIHPWCVSILRSGTVTVLGVHISQRDFDVDYVYGFYYRRDNVAIVLGFFILYAV